MMKSNEQIIQEAKSALLNVYDRFTVFSKLYDFNLSDEEQIKIVYNVYKNMITSIIIKYFSI